jgi:hypothetical protein
MNSGRLGVGIMLAGTVLVGTRADGAQIDRPNLVVRVYATATAHFGEWRASIGEATAILEDAGVEAGWINCSETATAADTVLTRCAQPLKSNEIAVRIVRLEPSRHHREWTLGESLLDPVRRGGTLATVYIDRVEWLARAGGVSAGSLLARAMAHEIGHLVLGTTAHSRRGLMRAVWSREELIRAQAADWVFPADDATRLQTALARRLEATPDAVVVWNRH